MKAYDDEVKTLGISNWKFHYLWLPVLVGFVVLLSWGIAISPRFDDIGQFRDDTASVKSKINDLDQKRNYLLSADEEDLKQKESLLSLTLPSHKNVYYLLTVVQSIAQNYGFVVDSFSVSPGKIENASDSAKLQTTNEALTRVPVMMTLFGTKDKYLDLVEAIENSLPLLSIDAFKMADDGGGAVKLNLTVATFFSTDKFDIKVGNLKLADLTLTKDELITIERLTRFRKLDMGQLTVTESGQYTIYDRNDPFTNF